MTMHPPAPATTSAPISTAADLRGRDVLTLANFRAEAVRGIFERAAAMKRDPGPFRRSLDGIAVAMLFEKPSLRTKMSFEVGIAMLGGHPVFMDHASQRLGARESVRDYGKNLERWVKCIVARVYAQTALEEMAEAASCPVINALSDRYHPCQALADLFTLWERAGHDAGRLRETRVAYLGDGNNVCASLMHAACLLGVPMTVITPPGYAPAPDVVRECEAFAAREGSTLRVTTDPAAVQGHDAVYTDVWVSMGQAGGVDEVTRRRKIFSKYQVNAEAMALASRGRPSPAVFMHCLPAQRGLEVTDEVIDAPTSVVYDQAENRMWAQNALLTLMFAPR
ncbi:MAG: ornithine carbamoyltransferase [Planctomycetota bacterium]|nr:ornithine carbamoyltransferase [Planctomycetota bacterium]